MATNSTVFRFSCNDLRTPGVRSPADLTECPPGWKQTGGLIPDRSARAHVPLHQVSGQFGTREPGILSSGI